MLLGQPIRTSSGNEAGLGTLTPLSDSSLMSIGDHFLPDPTASVLRRRANGRLSSRSSIDLVLFFGSDFAFPLAVGFGRSWSLPPRLLAVWIF
jgi:hypothetical protein